MTEDPVAALALRLLALSLVAVGGANTILPEIHRFVVEQEGWMTAAEFAQLYGLGQAAPGPNVLYVTLIGWHVGGIAGAAAATVAMCGPSCLLSFAAARLWFRFNEKPWWPPVRAGLAAVTVGLVLATGYILTRAADDSGLDFAITGVTAAVLLLTRLNPLWLLGGAALLGAAGSL